MTRTLVAVLLLGGLLLTPSASAQEDDGPEPPGVARLIPLERAAGDAADTPMALAGEFVYWLRAGRGGIQLVSAPAGGGAAPAVVQTFAVTRTRRLHGITLTGSPATVAVRLDYVDEDTDRLYAAAPGSGPLPQVATAADGVDPATADGTLAPQVQAVDGGLLTLEPAPGDENDPLVRGSLVLRPDGGRAAPVPVALPPQAYAPRAVARGGLLAVPIRRPSRLGFIEFSAVAVVEIGSGRELRRVPLPRAAAIPDALAVDAAGAIAVAGDELRFSPAGSRGFEVLDVEANDSGDVFGAPRLWLAGGRVALMRDLDIGTVVEVVAPVGDGRGTTRPVFRSLPAGGGYPAFSYDGRRIALAGPHCRSVGVAEGLAAPLAPGPCPRTAVGVISTEDAVFAEDEPQRASIGLRVTCLTAPGRACRVQVEVTVRWRGRSLGRYGPARLSVPVGEEAFRALAVPERVQRRIVEDSGPSGRPPSGAPADHLELETRAFAVENGRRVKIFDDAP